MKPTAKRGLGRGFDALLPQDFDKTLLLETGEKIQKLPLEKVKPDTQQPRTNFDLDAIEQLAGSIKRYGVLQPIIVRPLEKSDEYIIVAGERRWRASKAAGLKTIPSIIRTIKDLEHLELALVENVQRVDLSPLEQAVSIERLHQQFSLKYEAIAERLGKAPSTINNIVRLLQLPNEARESLDKKEISEGHARAILALKADPAKQLELLQNIMHHNWSVREAERFVASVKAGVADKKIVHQRVQTETPQTKQLGKRLQAPVHIRRTARGGRVELGFKTDEELQKLLDILGQL
jgi:ParB family chromosome partitioning protein